MINEYVLCEKQDLIDIANSVRQKNNTDNSYLITDLPNAINSLNVNNLQTAKIIFPEQFELTGLIAYVTVEKNTIVYKTVDLNSLTGQSIDVLAGSFCYCQHNYFESNTLIINHPGVVHIDNKLIFILVDAAGATIEIQYADNAPLSLREV